MLMAFLARGLFSFIFLSITTGCVMHKNNELIKVEVKQCPLLCSHEFKLCSKTCTNNCSKCITSADNKALMDYSKYIEEKRIVGGFVTRGLKSYRDPLQCRKVNCNCTADLMTCTQNCMGIIQKSLQSVPLCN